MYIRDDNTKTKGLGIKKKVPFTDANLTKWKIKWN